MQVKVTLNSGYVADTCQHRVSKEAYKTGASGFEVGVETAVLGGETFKKTVHRQQTFLLYIRSGSRVFARPTGAELQEIQEPHVEEPP